MRVMRLRVITALLPATEIPAALFSAFCFLLSFVSVTLFCQVFSLPPPHHSFSLQSHDGSICLTFPPLPWCLFFFHHIIHHLLILPEDVQCAPCGLQISDKVFKSLELSMTTQDMNPQLLYNLQLDSIMLGYHAHRTNKVHGLWIPTCIFVGLDHQSMQPSDKDKNN